MPKKAFIIVLVRIRNAGEEMYKSIVQQPCEDKDIPAQNEQEIMYAQAQNAIYAMSVITIRHSATFARFTI